MQRLILIFLIILALSCDQKLEVDTKTVLNEYDENGKLIVYCEEAYAKLWQENKNLNVTVVDTFYINQKARAEKDIKNGTLIYFDNHLREFEKLTKMLNKFGIEAKEHLRRDVFIGGFNPYGYEDEMYDEINRRFGENFIDSLYLIAQKEYVMEHPNVEYLEDGKDLREKYLGK